MRITPSLPFIILTLLAVLMPVMGGALADENRWRSVPGPVSAQIVRIIDGDTLLVDAHPWPGHAVRVSVRLRGIDTPERRSRCDSERLAANRARDELTRLVAGFSTIELINIAGGKYYGRVLADLKAGDRDIATAMLESGLASPYLGGKRVRAHCG